MCPCLTCFYPDQPCRTTCNGAYVPCPLVEIDKVVQQPLVYTTLSANYASAATSFIKTKAGRIIIISLDFKCVLLLLLHIFLQRLDPHFSCTWPFLTPTGLSSLARCSPIPVSGEILATPLLNWTGKWDR